MHALLVGVVYTIAGRGLCRSCDSESKWQLCVVAANGMKNQILVTTSAFQKKKCTAPLGSFRDFLSHKGKILYYCAVHTLLTPVGLYRTEYHNQNIEDSLSRGKENVTFTCCIT